MTHPIRVTCPMCGGVGDVPFAKVHARLARLCERMYSQPPLSAQDLHAAAPGDVSVTAYNNRLEDLRALGFVERRKQGRRWVYSLTAAGEQVARHA
jgi:DNA-binding HxlR family transcriptional regulator